MKRILAFLLTFCLIVPCFASCSAKLALNTAEETETEEAANHGDDVIPEDQNKVDDDVPSAPTEHMLDGKKVIFIGNSYTYYGNAVLTNARSQLKQEERVNNQGYFYQICKANGANVNVTNWTFGGHSLTDIFVNCAADRGCNDVDHKSYLTDRYYDYVFLQEHGKEGKITNAEFLRQIDAIQALFREANPNVKFFFLTQRRAYELDLKWLSVLKELPQKDITVVEWGALVEDIIQGKTQVPNATLSYNQNSFIVSQSASDGYHPNMLTGYITAQMAYCAITGESAVGQPYDFCTNTLIKSSFSASAFIEKYYKNGATTNMSEIFKSPEDMKGLQTLMDQYLAAKYYENY